VTELDAEALAEKLGHRFAAHVDLEQVTPGRFRFTLLSKGFEGVPHLRRQDEAWAYIDTIASREISMDIWLLLTLAPLLVDESLVALMP